MASRPANAMPSESKAFRVIIVGGGVAGLTLAAMLERFELDYLVLEARDDIAPPMGAAIGLMPNGIYIFDQLGLYGPIKEAAGDANLEDSFISDHNGRPLITMKHMMYHQEKRHGYSMLFFNRQWLLRVLYEQLKHKDRIRLGSRVDHIEQVSGGIQVTTDDGQSHSGHILIGADGIHSVIRREMRRIAESTTPGYFKANEEDRVPCYYQCSFGIAQDVQGWPESEQGFTTGHGQSFFTMSGPGGRCYWFLFVKLPETRYGTQIPTYTKEEEARFVEKYTHLKIKENLTFGAIYAERTTSGLTTLHEVVFKKWFFGRIFCMGDSVHKPHPIGGMGGNAAVETAAEFINALMDTMIHRGGSLEHLSEDEIRSVFQRVQDARIERANLIVSASHEQQALNAHENPLIHTLIMRVVLPLSSSHNFIRVLSETIIGGSRLKHLDPPSRPHVMPYEHELPARPLGARARRIVRLLFILGMILLLLKSSGASFKTSDSRIVSGSEVALLKQAWLNNTTGHAENAVDQLLSLFSSTPGLRLTYLLTNTIAPILIYTVEGYRLGRKGTILSLPILFTLGIQAWGLHNIIPLYAIFSALHSDQNTLDRSVRVEVAKSLVPALVIGLGIPTGLIIGTTVDESGWVDWIELPPILFSALVYMNSSLRQLLSTSKPTFESEKHSEWYSTEDVPILKRTYQLAAVVQASVHIAILSSVLFFSEPPVFTGFVGAVTFLKKSLHSLRSSDGPISLEYNMITSAQLAMIGHILFEVWKLRRQGYITTSSAVRALLGTIFGQLVLGPGATWVVVWSWREDVVSGLSKLHGGKEADI